MHLNNLNDPVLNVLIRVVGVNALKAYKGSREVASDIHNLGT